MKRSTILMLYLFMFLTLGACDQGKSPVEPLPPSPTNQVTAGQVHTEFLNELFQKQESLNSQGMSKTAYQAAYIQALCTTANDIGTKYGMDPMTQEEVLAAYRKGQERALQDPVKLADDFLSVQGQGAVDWWDRFASEAEVDNAREIYQKHVALYGAPQPGGRLDTLVDIAISSAEFWNEYRGDDLFVYQNPDLPLMYKSWKKFLRLAVNIVVDGVAGGLAGAGAATFTGPVGAAAAAGVVGGLASKGADDTLYGNIMYNPTIFDAVQGNPGTVYQGR